ncbi:hypothetical protein CBL_02576 [Carabus blaptoides fortunei]
MRVSGHVPTADSLDSDLAYPSSCWQPLAQAHGPAPGTELVTAYVAHVKIYAVYILTSMTVRARLIVTAECGAMVVSPCGPGVELYATCTFTLPFRLYRTLRTTEYSVCMCR